MKSGKNNSIAWLSLNFNRDSDIENYYNIVAYILHFSNLYLKELIFQCDCILQTFFSYVMTGLAFINGGRTALQRSWGKVCS